MGVFPFFLHNKPELIGLTDLLAKKGHYTMFIDKVENYKDNLFWV